jgi:hypothetical protein
MRWHGRHMVVATVVAVAAAGNARADALTLSLDPPVLQQLGLPPVPTPPPLPSLPSVPVPTPPPLPSLPSVPVPKPPSLPSLPSVPAPAPSQGGSVPVPVPRHTVSRATAPAAAPTGGGSSGSGGSRRAPSSASSGSRAGGGTGRSSGSSASRRAASSGRSASATRRRARRHEPSPRQLRRVLAPLAACVATLGPRQERVLVRRAGLRGFKGASRVETAARLHLTVRRVARLEHRGLRALRRKARAGACDAPAPAPAAAPAVAATGVGLSLQAAPAAPTAPVPRQEVKAVQESGSGSVDVLAESAPNLRNVAPVAGAEAAVRAGRSYAAEHPFQFALALLVSLLCALLLVREVRRA